MELFFTDTYKNGDTEIVLPPDESNHAGKVYRRSAGDSLDLTDGQGHHIKAEIVAAERRQLRLRILNSQRVKFPPENNIDVAVAIIRPNRFDWAVEKLTEMGIRRIIPLVTRYTSFDHIKTEHLQKIAVSAIKQSGQFYLPDIMPPQTWEVWMESARQSTNARFLAHPGSKETLAEIANSDFPCTVAIGPEGGFHPAEIDLALDAGFLPLDLGQTILRTETASVAAVTLLKWFFRQ